MAIQNQFLQNGYFAEMIGQKFDASEVDGLCFDLNIDKDLFPQNNKDTKIRELILWCQRNDRLEDLMKILSVKRPKIKWSEFIGLEDSTILSLNHLWQQVWHHQLNHEVGASLSFLYKIKEIDPYDWRVNSEIRKMEYEFKKGWVDREGIARMDFLLRDVAFKNNDKGIPELNKMPQKFNPTKPQRILLLLSLIVGAFVFAYILNDLGAFEVIGHLLREIFGK